MLRVLNIIGSLECRGGETTVMNHYRTIDRTKIQFDFLLTKRETYYEAEARALGARIFYRPVRKIRLPIISSIATMKYIAQIVKKNSKIEIIHIHSNLPSSVTKHTLTALLCKTPVIIAHSRSALPKTSFLQRMCQPLLRATATHWIGCSTQAGISLFGAKALCSKKFMLMPNARDIDIFRYNADIRAVTRAELNLNNRYCIINVANITHPKNHSFLLDLFAHLHTIRRDSLLLIVGEGELLSELTAKAKELNIEDSVRFLGHRDDVPNLLQAADVFVLPSLYEGLPGVIIEAQAAGLPCLISDAVTGECKLTDAVEFLPINAGEEIWTERILAYRNHVRRDTLEDVRKGGYDIKDAAKRLEDFYIEAFKSSE